MSTGLRAIEVKKALADLMVGRFVFREGDLCLGLAVPASVYDRADARQKSTKWVSPYV
jgi:hypothetical protein